MKAYRITRGIIAVLLMGAALPAVSQSMNLTIGTGGIGVSGNLPGISVRAGNAARYYYDDDDDDWDEDDWEDYYKHKKKAYKKYYKKHHKKDKKHKHSSYRYGRGQHSGHKSEARPIYQRDSYRPGHHRKDVVVKRAKAKKAVKKVLRRQGK